MNTLVVLGGPDGERDISFLLEATRLLAASLDVDTTLATVARLSLPHPGSWCLVDLCEGDAIRRVAVVHPDPAHQALAEQLSEGWPPWRDNAPGCSSITRTTRTQIVFPVPDAMLVSTAGSPENLALLRDLGIGCFMTIPLVVGSEVLGAITYVSPDYDHPFSELEQLLAEDLAARCAIAIQNSRSLRRAERALAEAELSEERFSRTISIAAEAIISVDEGQRIVLFNEGAEHIFGYAKAEIIGQHLNLLLPLRARDVHGQHVAAFGRSPEVARRMGQRHQISGRRKNGEEFPAEASISKFDLGGERVYTVVLRDITEAENAKLGLEHLLGAVTQANHDRARLIRGVTHDVKNPLGAADGYAQLLEMELQGKLGDEQMAIVAGVRRGIRHALAIIADLLDVSRAESSGLSVRPERIDLAAVVSGAIEDHRGAAEAAGHTLVPMLSPTDEAEPVGVSADPARVREVLDNLVSNAIKYTPAPGRISISTAVVSDGHGPGPGGWVAAHVRDNGPGVPEDERERIFGEFHRLHANRDAIGHGVGLAISRRIARLMGGEITVGGTLGEGAVFSLWLPVETDATREGPVDADLSTMVGASR